MNKSKCSECTISTELNNDCCKEDRQIQCIKKLIKACLSSILQILNVQQEDEKKRKIVSTIFKNGINSLYCLIPKQTDMILYFDGATMHAFLEFPADDLNKLAKNAISQEGHIKADECVIFISSTRKACSMTRCSLEGETVLNALKMHLSRSKTVTITNKTFIDKFTLCEYKTSVYNPNEVFCIHNLFSERTADTNRRQNNITKIKKHNVSHDTSHLRFHIDKVISLRQCSERKENQPPLAVNPPREYVVFPAHGIQHDNPAFPSYPTRVSEENGHFEITPSFTTLAHRQLCEAAVNRTERGHVPSTENQNHENAIGPHLTHANYSQAEEAQNNSTRLGGAHLRSATGSGGNRLQSAHLTTHATSESKPLARHPDYRDYYQRLLSFTNWPGYARQDPTHLCQCGFFYTGNADLVRCFQCGIGLKDFRPDDVPLVEHVRYSPDCHFLLEILGPGQLAEYKRSILGDNANQGTFQQQQPYQHQVPNVGAPNQYNGLPTRTPQQAHQQVTTPYGQSPHLRPNDLRSTAMNYTSVTNQQYSTATSQQELQHPCQHGPIPPNTASDVTYRHPEYALLDTRLASFTKWPPGIIQTPRQIAEAGFFYTGMSDVVRCWACDGGLQKWDPQDDPWIEHCYYFPTCPFAIQQKGSGYIALVQQQARGNKMTEGNKTPATNSSVAQKRSSTGIHNDLQKMTIAEHDPMLSTVAEQSLREMGYDKTKIKLAIEKLRRQGTSDPTAEQIVDIIEGEVENIPTNNNSQPNEMHRSTSEVFHENERLKSLLLCMACNENNVNVLFLPCTHHRMCTICAHTVTHCPLCNRFIQEKVKTYMS